MRNRLIKIVLSLTFISFFGLDLYAQCDSVNSVINSKIRFLGSWNAQGRPNYIEPEKDTVSKEIRNFINTILPESVNITDSGYFNDSVKPNTELLDSANVYLTFVHEGAGWKNSLGYYTYELDNPPKTYEEIDSMVIVFPNVDSVNVISAGDKIHLGLFPPNIGIGYFLITRGWTGDTICMKDKIVFTDKDLNTFTSLENRQHTVMLNYEDEKRFLLGIEDQPRPSGDKDFNDAVFYISADNYEAIDSTEVPKIPVAEIFGDTICSEDGLATITIELSGTPPFTFTYNNGSEDIEVTDFSGDIYSFETAVKDTFTLVSVYDADGMGIVKGNAVIQILELTAGLVSNSITTCDNVSEAEAQIFVKGFPPYDITYTENGQEISLTDITEDTITFMADISKEYVLTSVTDRFCTINLEEALEIEEFEKPSASLETIDSTLCEGTSFDAEVSFTGEAPFTFIYEINSVKDTIITENTTYAFEIEESVVITPVAISDANCSGEMVSGSVNVNYFDAPEVEITTPEIQCGINGIAEIILEFSGSAPFSFEYDHSGNIISETTSGTATVELGINESFKLLSYSDENCDGNIVDSTSTFYNYSIPTAEIISEDIINCGNESSTIEIEFKGKAPFTAVITNGTTKDTITTNQSVYSFQTSEEGTFELLSVKNENCTGNVSGEVTINKYDAPTVGFDYPVVSCDATEDATITITFDGTAPFSYEYEISGANFSESTEENVVEVIVPLNNSFKLLSFSDAMCEGEVDPNEAVFNNFTSPVAELVTQSAYICNGTEAQLAINFDGPGPYTFVISNGVEKDTVTTSESEYIYETANAGTYNILSVSNAQCDGTVIGQATVEIKATPTFTVDASNNTICGENEAEIIIEFTGTAPFSFDFRSGGQTTNFVSDESIYTLMLSESGTYEILNVSDAYCQNSESEIFEIIHFDQPLIGFNAPDFLCENETGVINLTMTGAAPFTFTITHNGIEESITTFEIDYDYEISEAGTYAITSFYDANCIGNTEGLSVTIEDAISPEAIIGYDEVICMGETSEVTFNFTGESPWTFTLKKEGFEETYTSTESEFTFSLSEGGMYEIISFSDARCSNTIAEVIQISENPKPTAEISGGGELCGEGETATINIALTGESPFTFTYTNGVVESEITTDQNEFSFETSEAGDYQLVSVSDQNCDGEVNGLAAVINSIDNIDGEILGDDAVCENEEFTLSLSLSETIENITWSTTGQGQLISNGSEISYIPSEGENGDIEFTATIANECGEKTFTKTIRIIAIPVSDFNVSPDELFTNKDIIFVADGDISANYTWTLGDGTTLTGDEIIHLYENAGLYDVTLTAVVEGCESGTTKTITVKSLNELYVPNVFNPNALHPENQVVKVYGSNVSESNFSFKIVNRWGNVMYQTNSFFEANNQGWDGREFNNEEMQALSTFSYILVGQFKDGETFERTGTITLLQ